ncbi:MAG: efflux transporter outer membrane subunit [Planctomycetes bacterium]|nr:efflux transporter outer membrane subunit [Planctomycetota bacterium]
MKRYIFSLLLILLVSCKSAPTGPLSVLNLTVPESWSAEHQSDGLIGDTWWQKFDDERLNAVIAMALKHNYNLKIASLNVETALAEARIAGANLYPQLSGGLKATRATQNYIGLPFPGLEDKILTSRSTTYGASLNLNWEADLWGGIRAGKNAARANVNAARADLSGAKLSLIAQTTKVWFSAVEIKQQLEIAETILTDHRQTLKWTRERYERGLVPLTKLRLARTNLAASETVVSQWAEQNERIVRQLEILMGQYPAGELAVSETLNPLKNNVPAGLPSELVNRRPDLVAAEYRLFAATKLVTRAKTNLYPRFSLTSSVGTSSSELKDLTDGDFGIWNVMGNLLQPLFQGGRLRAGVKLAKARREQALASFGNAVLNAYGEVETALRTIEHLNQRLEQIELISEESEAIHQITRERYQRGLANRLALIDARRQSLAIRGKLLTIQRQQLEGRINLYLALGGGFNKETKK